MISTHVLDLTLGKPGRGIHVTLELLESGNAWRTLGTAVTNDDGRTGALADATTLGGRTCRLSFDTRAYFEQTGQRAFFPRIDVTFVVGPGETRYHVPVLLSPFGYSTYRGS
jgi:5-hydroxyisourate hydrolase